jgi:hypothetical protein
MRLTPTIVKYLDFFLVYSLVFITTSCQNDREKIGQEIYSKIERFRQANGHVPSGLDDIGLEEKMEGPVYYLKKSDSTYVLYYGGGLGESFVLDTITGEWKSDGQ